MVDNATVSLRPFREEDRDIILDILTDETVKKTYMVPDYPYREDASPLFRRLFELSMQTDRYVRCIRINDAPAGFLNDVEITGKQIELGYVIHPAHQGRGYMTKALNIAISELFQRGFTEVITGAFEENRASLRVMEKCGMRKLEKTDEIAYRGRTHRCIYYSRRNNEVTDDE